jgi:hypothetical protein
MMMSVPQASQCESAGTAHINGAQSAASSVTVGGAAPSLAVMPQAVLAGPAQRLQPMPYGQHPLADLAP